MNIRDVLLVLGVAAAVSIVSIATIKHQSQSQLAIHDNDLRMLPVSDIGQPQLHTTEGAGRVLKMSEAPAEKPQIAPKPRNYQEVPQQVRRLVAVVDNGDGTFRDVYEDEVRQLSREEDTASDITLSSGELPSEIAKVLEEMEGPVGANVLEMNRQVRDGVRTVNGDLAEQVLRTQIATQPELRGLNVSVSCASRLCEMQAVRALPGVTADSIATALTRVSMTREFTDLYRLRVALDLAAGDAPYWIWYWDERE